MLPLPSANVTPHRGPGGGFGKSPPRWTFTAATLGVQFFDDDHPTASLAVWAYVVPAEAMQHDVLLGRDNWRLRSAAGRQRAQCGVDLTLQGV